MTNGYRAVLLTVLTLSVFTLAIVELTGISKNSLSGRRYNNGEGPGTFYSKNGETYRGEIYPEQTRTRSELVAEMPKTTMQFYETKHNFGNVPEGKVMTHVFRFKNTGEHPLMIAKTDVTCGCTVPNFPLETIPSGQEGEVTIVYNSAGHSGLQQKNIIIHSNAMPEAVSIGIQAEVH